MNIKVIIKTFTPTKSDLFLILGLIVFISLAAACAIITATGIWFGLVYMFGEKMATDISTGLICGFWFWLLIGVPLYDRYKRIEREIER